MREKGEKEDIVGDASKQRGEDKGKKDKGWGESREQE